MREKGTFRARVYITLSRCPMLSQYIYILSNINIYKPH